MYENLKNKVALYIEGDLDVLKNTHDLLKDFFKEFYTARDGELGYSVYVDNKIDILLIGIEIPKINGIDLIKKIRAKNKDIPIVVISAYTKKDYLLASIELNLKKYIVKPLTSKKIHLMLKKLDDSFANSNTVELADGVFLFRDKLSISHNGIDYNLTRKEFAILDALSHKKVISYDEIYDLWEDKTPSQNAIRSCIKKLRKKLPDKFIKNKNGIGYSL